MLVQSMGRALVKIATTTLAKDILDADRLLTRLAATLRETERILSEDHDPERARTALRLIRMVREDENL